MTMLPPDPHAAGAPGGAPPVSGLERLLRAMSVFTMLMTLPQVFAIWSRREAQGVSLVSWATYLLAASLWLVYGVRKRDQTIYLACIGWILLDLAIVVGVVLYG
jgi:uncharacterized protein with PQ loop repeat